MKKIFLPALLLMFSEFSFAQHSDPGSTPPFIGYMNGNQFMISFRDDGQLAGFLPGIDLRGEWKGNEYISDMTPLLGIELPIKDYNKDGKPDTLHTVIISRGPRNHQSEERDPVDNHFWGWNPRPGFRNPNPLPGWESPAISIFKYTWPETWPDHPEYGSGKWDGLLGPDSLVGGLESYFVIDDFWDTETNYRYGFYPDSSDLSLTGNGIVISVRYIQLSNYLFENTLFRIYDIKNIGKQNYSRVVFGNIVGTLSGGYGDSGDDVSEYDPLTEVIYSWDYDYKGVNGQKMGAMGEAVIEAPVQHKIGSFEFFNLSINPDMSNDTSLWKRMIPGRFYPPFPSVPQDGDYIYGTDYFSLNAGETKRIVSVISMGETKSDVAQNIKLAEVLYNSDFNIQKLTSYIKLTNLNYYRELKSNENITWTAANYEGNVDLWFSPDAGSSWQLLDTSISNNGVYELNTSVIEDCYLGKLRVFLKNDIGSIIGYDESAYFSINNSPNGKPYLKIISPEFNNDVVTEENLTLRLLAGDPDNQQLQIKAFFSNDGGFSYNLIQTKPVVSDTSVQDLNISIAGSPNSDDCRIKLQLTDGTNSVYDSTSNFKKNNEREVLSSAYIEKVSGNSVAQVKINIIDSTKLTGHEYMITFDDTSSIVRKNFSVFDITKGQRVIESVPLYSGSESPVFDGLDFLANDVTTRVDSSGSGWNMGVSKDFNFNFQSLKSDRYYSYNLPDDYKIVFYNTVIDTSVDIRDYTDYFRGILPKPINFEVYNLTTNKKLKVVLNKTGTISTTFQIFFIEELFGKEGLSWQVTIRYPEKDVNPTGGDTLNLMTIKGLSIFDSIKIKSIPVSVKEKDYMPDNFALMQNYPNPFNPTTTIKFRIPAGSTFKTELKVYDILGREVKTLLNKVINPGSYNINFDAEGLSSGIYFYVLSASGISGNYVETRKMVLLK